MCIRDSIISFSKSTTDNLCLQFLKSSGIVSNDDDSRWSMMTLGGLEDNRKQHIGRYQDGETMLLSTVLRYTGYTGYERH